MQNILRTLVYCISFSIPIFATTGLAASPHGFWFNEKNNQILNVLTRKKSKDWEFPGKIVLVNFVQGAVTWGAYSCQGKRKSLTCKGVNPSMYETKYKPVHVQASIQNAIIKVTIQRWVENEDMEFVKVKETFDYRRVLNPYVGYWWALKFPRQLHITKGNKCSVIFPEKMDESTFKVLTVPAICKFTKKELQITYTLKKKKVLEKFPLSRSFMTKEPQIMITVKIDKLKMRRSLTNNYQLAASMLLFMMPPNSKK